MDVILDTNKRYTYADYLTWDDDTRRELIHGVVHVLPSAYRTIAACVRGDLSYLLSEIVEKHGGKHEMFLAPFDVRFPRGGATSDDQIDTVVQPGICVICDQSKLDDLGCCGAPDMIVEILSASTARRDLNEKFMLYEESGVREYWVVYPHEHVITVYVLQENGKYDDGTNYEQTDAIPVHIFDGCTLNMKDIYKPIWANVGG